MFAVAKLELVHIVQIVYVAICLFVAHWHIKRNDMKESLDSAKLGDMQVGNLAWYLLAVIWPLLLFAYLIEPKSKRDQNSKD